MIEFVIDDREGQRLDNFLFQIYKSTPNSHVYRMLRKGRIRVNGKVCRDNTYRLLAEDVLIIPTPVNDAKSINPSETLVEKVKSMIVDETEDYWLLNKHSGICVHKSERDVFGVIEVMQYIYSDAHLVHRIDRNTSGCLLVAKSYKSLAMLQAQWRERSVKKRYQLVVCGQWQYGAVLQVDKPLLRLEKPNQGAKVVVSNKGKSAKTTFQLVTQYESHALLEAEIHTGRTHQIRVHAAEIGHPILGDGRYGQAKNAFFAGMFLHAKEVTLDSGIVLSCDLSDAHQKALKALP
ncbi:MAG: RluA family pseudouridine synthase [Pseudomonadota bacterium]|nr:RluA family pseudouridine synthase [Pseudomonadota bacterium]